MFCSNFKICSITCAIRYIEMNIQNCMLPRCHHDGQNGRPGRILNICNLLAELITSSIQNVHSIRSKVLCKNFGILLDGLVLSVQKVVLNVLNLLNFGILLDGLVLSVQKVENI